MTQAFSIRDARPSDAPFLAECIFAGLHLYDFEEIVNDDHRHAFGTDFLRMIYTV